jgi:hypothetical protein
MKIRNFHASFVLVRVYLEGVYFPYVKSINIQQSAGGAQCSIDVPPSKFINMEEMVGMTIHIFYANERVIELFEDDYKNEEPRNGGWPILFEGELSEFHESSHLEGESLSLTFISMGSAFDQTLLYFYDPSRQRDAVNVPYQSMFIGNTSISLDVNGPLSRTSAIYNAIGDAIANLEGSDEGRSIAYTAAILAIMRDAEIRHVLFGYFNNKHKLTQRFASYPDPDVQKMISLRNLQAIVENHITALPPETSLSDLMQVVSEMIKYNWLYLPQPVLRSGTKFREQTELKNDGTEEIYEDIKGAVDSLLKTGRVYGEPVGEKPNKIVSVREFENLIYQEFKKAKEQSVLTLENNLDVFNALDPFANEGTASTENKRLIILSTLDVIKQGYYPLVSGSIQAKGDVEQEASRLLGEDGKPQNVVSATGLEQEYLRKRDELHQFALTPMLMFTQPPKCNVFFPSQLSQHGISVPLKRRLTRLIARCQPMPSVNGGQNILEWYVAPQQQSFHKMGDNKLEKYTEQYINYLDFVTGESKR